MLRTDGLYREDSGDSSSCMLLCEGGRGVRSWVSFGMLTHEAARLLVNETNDFHLTSWPSAEPPRERSRARMTWVATEDGDGVEFKWTLKWTLNGRSGETAQSDLGAVLDDGRLLRLRFQDKGNKLGTPRDSHFHPIDPRAFGAEWGPADDARLVRERLERGESSRAGVGLAAALGYEGASIALGEKPLAAPNRQQVVSAIVTLGGAAAVRSVLGLVWDEENEVHFNQGTIAEDAPKGSAQHRVMTAITKWLQSGKSKDLDKARELAGKLDEYSEQVLKLIVLGEMEGAKLEQALHEFLASFITESEGRAFEFMKTTLLPWVLEGRDRYG